MASLKLTNLRAHFFREFRSILIEEATLLRLIGIEGALENGAIISVTVESSSIIFIGPQPVGHLATVFQRNSECEIEK